MTEREQILGRIREALGQKAPVPGHPADASANQHATMLDARRWLPPVGETFDEQLALFRQNIAALRGDFHLVSDRADLARSLVELARNEGWKAIGAHSGSLADVAVAHLGLPICHTDRRFQIEALEKCDAGITECDALIAQTGSILVTSKSAGGRALSVLPPHHVVIASREQLIPDLPAAMALLKKKYSPNYPSFISLITGPSRTGDIERILVLGAHGPKRLTIFCV